MNGKPRLVRLSILLAVTMCAASTVYGKQDCDAARASAEVAASRTAWADSRSDDALKFLNDSIEDCASYEAYEQLGEYYSILGAQRGRDYYEKAVDAFINAEAVATDAQQRANAIYQYALLLDTVGQPASAVPLLDQARNLDPKHAEIAALQAKVEEQSMHLTQSQAGRALEFPLYKKLRSRAGTSIPDQASSTSRQEDDVVELPFVPIHFVTNSTEPDEGSRSNLTGLADALADPKRRSDRFIVIGHADQRGSDAYNIDLSIRRARAVSDFLVGRQPSLQGRIVAEGRGAREPLDQGSSEHAYWVNRRLQVVMKSQNAIGNSSP